jgi:hypothetical protein
MSTRSSVEQYPQSPQDRRLQDRRAARRRVLLSLDDWSEPAVYRTPRPFREVSRAPKAIRSSNLWTGVHIAVILACAAQALYPPTHQLRLFTVVFDLALMPLYFFLLIRSVGEDKTADATLGEIYAQVKGGRRLPRAGLAFAATVALVVTTLYSSSGHR